MPYHYGGYDPYSIQNLWAPMAAQMQEQSEDQMNRLREEFGASGMRYSTPLMMAQQEGLRGTARDMNQMFSQLQYQDAQDAYRRNMEMIDQMFGMGMQERMMTDQDLDRAYKEWLRQLNEPLDYLSQLLGPTGPSGGRDVSVTQDSPGWFDQYAMPLILAWIGRG